MGHSSGAEPPLITSGPALSELIMGQLNSFLLSFLACSNNLRNEIESNPDLFFRTELRDVYFDAVKKAASLVGADPANMVLCPNVTSALNAVLKSIRLKPEDQVCDWYRSSIHQTGEAKCIGFQFQCSNLH